MSRWMLEWFWRGRTYKDIADQERKIDPNVTEDNIRQWIEEERQKISAKSLEAVVKNATMGDIPAIEWLEKRGFLAISPLEKD